MVAVLFFDKEITASDTNIVQIVQWFEQRKKQLYLNTNKKCEFIASLFSIDGFKPTS